MSTNKDIIAKNMLYGNYFQACVEGKKQFENNKAYYKTPVVGDVVFFYVASKKRIGHVGIVSSVDSNKKIFKTIEGNTSSDSSFTANGGCVNTHTYSYSNVGGTNRVNGFGRPKYSNTNCTVTHLIDTAKKEIGYLEKKSNKDLDSKTANAGSNNYTKYGKWYGNNGDFWCAQFVSWCFYEAVRTYVIPTNNSNTVIKEINNMSDNIKRVVDVSTYNGNIKWNDAKANHIDGAIIKIINKQLKLDDQFINNYNGCHKNKIPWGVYNYSYATTVSKVKSDMKLICDKLDTLDRTYFKYGVWLDVEDNCQAKLSKSALAEIINAAQTVVESRGYTFGIYTGMDYCKENLDVSKIKTKNWWVARYAGKSELKITTAPAESYNPSKKITVKDMIAWQYTEKGVIYKGFSTGNSNHFDFSLWYKDPTPPTKSSTSTTTTNPAATQPSYNHTQFVKDCQTILGCKVTGVANSELLAKTITISSKINRKHKLVKPIQKYLNSIGYNCGEPDCIAGTLFTNAVKKYQKANSCVVDGEITAKNKTWKKLLKL